MRYTIRRALAIAPIRKPDPPRAALRLQFFDRALLDFQWSSGYTPGRATRPEASSPPGSLGALFAMALALASMRAAAQDAPKAEIVAPVQLDANPVAYPDGATGEAVVVLEIEIEKDGTVGRIVVREG